LRELILGPALAPARVERSDKQLQARQQMRRTHAEPRWKHAPQVSTIEVTDVELRRVILIQSAAAVGIFECDLVGDPGDRVDALSGIAGPCLGKLDASDISRPIQQEAPCASIHREEQYIDQRTTSAVTPLVSDGAQAQAFARGLAIVGSVADLDQHPA
jgi:hypothetical protein